MVVRVEMGSEGGGIRTHDSGHLVHRGLWRSTLRGSLGGGVLLFHFGTDALFEDQRNFGQVGHQAFATNPIDRMPRFPGYGRTRHVSRESETVLCLDHYQAGLSTRIGSWPR